MTNQPLATSFATTPSGLVHPVHAPAVPHPLLGDDALGGEARQVDGVDELQVRHVVAAARGHTERGDGVERPRRDVPQDRERLDEVREFVEQRGLGRRELVVVGPRADQFGDRIKQKDRTPEDVERIATEFMKDMADNPDKYLSLPTKDSLDYKAMATMSDGQMYDPTNPLHFLEAEPATFAAIMAAWNPRRGRYSPIDQSC